MSEQHRPAFHFTPPANWMNDPNGLVFQDGVYHLFYQHHPGSTIWGPMHWGHAISHDLVNWQHCPIALYPDEHGMIFSGSAVVDHNNSAGFGTNALIAIFTYHNDHRESQNLAYSLDGGRTWVKYPGNPVIPVPDETPDFRDPKVFWYQDHWVMCLAAGKKVLFFVSSDLLHWEESGSFGDGYGAREGVWETPDLFELQVENTDESRWVLTHGVGSGAAAGGSGTQYFIGHFDGRTFKSENSRESILWMDHGADFYAPQSWNNEPSGRRLVLGWMTNWQYAALVPTSSWRGAFSIIREISLKKIGSSIQLVQRPLPELQMLRTEHLHLQEQIIEPSTNLLASVRGTCLEIIAGFKLTHNAGRFGFHVCAGEHERTTICYEIEKQTLSVDRTRSGQVDFFNGFAGVHSAVLIPQDDVIRLHIFIDSSSVEVFANDGIVTLTDCIFPAEASQELELFIDRGSIRLLYLDVFQLKPAQFQTTEN